jgi:hypothetical protein
MKRNMNVVNRWCIKNGRWSSYLLTRKPSLQCLKTQTIITTIHTAFLALDIWVVPSPLAQLSTNLTGHYIILPNLLPPKVHTRMSNCQPTGQPRFWKVKWLMVIVQKCWTLLLKCWTPNTLVGGLSIVLIKKLGRRFSCLQLSST